MKIKHTLWVLCLLIIACGELETVTNDLSPSTSDEISGEVTAVVHVTDFMSSALLSIVPDLSTASDEDILINVVDPLPHSDAILRVFDGLLYVVNRLGRDSVQVVDPDQNFETIHELSTGPGTNPQDILVVAPNKAYVTLYQPENLAGAEEILVINPQNGAFLEKIDLTALTDDDGERLVRAQRMTRVGDEVWVLIQDLNGSYQADTNGKIAVIEVNTNTLVDVDPDAAGTQGISLVGRNPSDLAYDTVNGRVWVSMTGVFQPDFTTDVSDPYGGLEGVDVTTYRSEGILIDDADLGGNARGVQISSNDMAFTIVGDTRVATFDPTELLVLDDSVYQSPGFFLPEILFDGTEHLLITERGDYEGKGAGLVILDLSNNLEPVGPLDVGGPPSSVAVIW